MRDTSQSSPTSPCVQNSTLQLVKTTCPPYVVRGDASSLRSWLLAVLSVLYSVSDRPGLSPLSRRLVLLYCGYPTPLQRFVEAPRSYQKSGKDSLHLALFLEGPDITCLPTVSEANIMELSARRACLFRNGQWAWTWTCPGRDWFLRSRMIQY